MKNDVVQDDYCPLCLQEKSKIELIKELNERIKELEELEEGKNKLEEQGQKLKGMLQVNINTIDRLLKEKFLERDSKPNFLMRFSKLKPPWMHFLVN